jgi:hypothetical protein
MQPWACTSWRGLVFVETAAAARRSALQRFQLGRAIVPAARNTQLGTGQDNFVPTAQLSQVTYKAGNGPDTIWERASDGLQFGAWSQAVPVVNAPAATPTHNASNIRCRLFRLAVP